MKRGKPMDVGKLIERLQEMPKDKSVVCLGERPDFQIGTVKVGRLHQDDEDDVVILGEGQ